VKADTGRIEKNVSEIANFLAKYLFVSWKSDNFAPVKQKDKTMNKLNAYIYVYFYFARNCEAGSCV